MRGDVQPYDFFGHELRKMIDVLCSECGLNHTVVVTPRSAKARRAYAESMRQSKGKEQPQR